MPDSDQPIPPAPPSDEAAAARRRWITFAEVLALIAVLISALTFWNSYKERTAAEADKAAEREQASTVAGTLLLRGSPERDGARLALAAADPHQTIQTQSFAFPAALGLGAIETVSDPRLEAGWFERPLLRATHDAPAADAASGDQRLPVAITTVFFSDGTMHRDVAIYDVGYRIEGGGLLGGHRVRLLGLSRVAAVPARNAQARVDGRWRARS